MRSHAAPLLWFQGQVCRGEEVPEQGVQEGGGGEVHRQEDAEEGAGGPRGGHPASRPAPAAAPASRRLRVARLLPAGAGAVSA